MDERDGWQRHTKGDDHTGATLGASARLSKTTALDLDYSGEFATDYSGNAIPTTFRVKWQPEAAPVLTSSSGVARPDATKTAPQRGFMHID